MRQRLVATLSSLLLALGALAVLQVATAPAATAATQIIPIPTSASGADRIVAHPNGSLWFIEEDANQVARVNPNGTISEFTQLAANAGTYDIIKDLDIAPDGTIWVLYETGQRVAQLDPSGTVLATGDLDGNYLDSIRVAPDGIVWMAGSDVVMTVRNGVIDYQPNYPECADALGEAADGSMWCRTDSGVTRLNPAGGGTTYPANDFASYPFAIAAGPVGSVWFGRYERGTIGFSESDGAVGFVDAGSGAITAYDTGERTAINSLVQGPDGNMWFTSIGAAKGIGHIAPNGTGGRLTAIGNYAPNSIAFGTDGAVYATDATNNVIIKTAIADLQVTNVDPGEGSVLGGAAAGGPAIKVKAGKKPLAVTRNRVALKVQCPKDAAAKCAGTAKLLTTGKKPKAVSGKAKYKIKAGKKKTLQLKLSKKGLRAVKKGKVAKLQVAFYAKGSKAPVAVQVIKVRRR